MSKAPRTEPAAGSRLWRIMAIGAIIVLVVCLAGVLVWFFADPLHLPGQVLQVLDQRASVAGMFTGTVLGAAALVVAVVALRAQLRAEHVRAQAGPSAPPEVPASDGAVAPDHDTSGSSTGQGAPDVQMEGTASGQGRVYRGGGHHRSYGGDHIEFHHSTFPGTVVGKVTGKQVNAPTPAAPDGTDDAAR